jgi:predicted ATP-dependent Lon-type protease
LRAERGKWTSPRSELISYAKMLCDYFSFVNKEAQRDNSYSDNVGRLMEQFCLKNNLQVKAIKEVHFLCLQLERLVFEATRSEDEFKSLFLSLDYPHPTDE